MADDNPEDAAFIEFGFGSFPREHVDAVTAWLKSEPPTPAMLACYEAMDAYASEQAMRPDYPTMPEEQDG